MASFTSKECGYVTEETTKTSAKRRGQSGVSKRQQTAITARVDRLVVKIDSIKDRVQALEELLGQRAQVLPRVEQP